MNNQCDDILNHLENIGPLTPLDALRHYGCFRLSARIYDLRQQGYEIESKRITKRKKTIAQYTLIGEKI